MFCKIAELQDTVKGFLRLDYRDASLKNTVQLHTPFFRIFDRYGYISSCLNNLNNKIRIYSLPRNFKLPHLLFFFAI